MPLQAPVCAATRSRRFEKLACYLAPLRRTGPVSQLSQGATRSYLGGAHFWDWAEALDGESQGEEMKATFAALNI